MIQGRDRDLSRTRVPQSRQARGGEDAAIPGGGRRARLRREGTSPSTHSPFLFLQRGWKLKGNEYHFETGAMDTGASKAVDSARLVKQNIFYAKQLEMLV